MASRHFAFGIRLKVTLIILMMALLPVGFLGWQAFNEQKRVITDEVTRNHRELSNVLAHGIYENLEYTRRLLTTISDLDTIKGLRAVEAGDFFSALVKYYPFFKLIYLVDSDKNVVATTNPGAALPADWRFTNAIKRSYQGSLSDVYTSAEGNPCMTLEAVIKSQEKGVIGVLIAEVDLIYIRELLKTALKRSKSQGLVLDEAGAVIARSSEDVKTLAISGTEALDNDITGVRDIGGERNLITAISLKKFDF
ncbi:MAG TPA: cache domain-containing protein, partial [Candidatus Ozemobacteraceae bacterium]|nr:cache domain-containing protein [Candidatus Ozemobacteraceae bacterium]